MNIDGHQLIKVLHKHIDEYLNDLSAPSIEQRDADFLRGRIEQCRQLLGQLERLEKSPY